MTELDMVAFLSPHKIIPVVALEQVEHAVPLARALMAGGIHLIEVTLRTPVAWDALAALRRQVPELVLGVGSVRSPEHLLQAAELQLDFAVSPGFTAPLLQAAHDLDLPYLPGVATASEAMRAFDAGHSVLKFFPAHQAGGAAMLKAWAAPLPELHFCPTGGVDASNAREYFGLPNVICVGGSWVAPPRLIQEERWEEISRLAQEASSLPREPAS